MPAVRTGREKRGRPKRDERVFETYASDETASAQARVLSRLALTKGLSVSEVATRARLQRNSVARSFLSRKPLPSTLERLAVAIGVAPIGIRALLDTLTERDVDAVLRTIHASASTQTRWAASDVRDEVRRGAVRAYVLAEHGLHEEAKADPFLAYADIIAAGDSSRSPVHTAFAWRRALAKNVVECLSEITSLVPGAARFTFVDELKTLEILREYMAPSPPAANRKRRKKHGRL